MAYYLYSCELQQRVFARRLINRADIFKGENRWNLEGMMGANNNHVIKIWSICFRETQYIVKKKKNRNMRQILPLE